ncbi:MAG: XdhC/CoxI family protein [Ancalomicrobiaceae bacterium]|nr:XdhC/CoxI family protein [Ancalomicrobiaceae bacterium]
MQNVYAELIREQSAGRSCAMATIVAFKGSIPSHGNAKMLVREDGSIAGTVGGGPVEAEAILAAREAMTADRPTMLSFSLNDNPRLDSGMVCGGSLDIYIEPICPKPAVYLFGAGHVGLMVESVARLAGFDTIVVDDRPEFANAERFPHATKVVAEPFEAAMAGLEVGARALVFIATRCHELDGQVLEWALSTPAGYIGMIGSKRKVTTVFTRLQGKGVAPAAFERVHAPVGLDIGADTPEEIAISVVAEFIAWRRRAEAVRPIMRNMRVLADQAHRKEAS